MNQRFVLSRASIASAAALLICSAGVTPAFSQECGDDQPLGECQVLVEINSTDGDIGFHWLTDGDDLNSTRIDDPNGVKVLKTAVSAPCGNRN